MNYISSKRAETHARYSRVTPGFQHNQHVDNSRKSFLSITEHLECGDSKINLKT
jgi:hypothetical protein